MQLELTTKQLKSFWSKVDVCPNYCWEWTASLCKGYGQAYFSTKKIYAHRAAWLIHYGYSEEYKNSFVCHKCDNPKCVNPEHLFLGTPRENMLDAKHKGRLLRGEQIKQSKLTEEQVLYIKTLVGQVSQREIGRMFGVSPGTIYYIHKGINWKHLE